MKAVSLRRAGSGEVIKVTTRGRSVAVLVLSGRATTAEGDLLDLGPPPKIGRAMRVSAALQEDRAERL